MPHAAQDPAEYDAVVVGGGPAGLSAALVLGRCRRRILVCDTGKPRNARSHAMHGYISRDGLRPLEFLRLARAEVESYGVEIVLREVVDAARAPGGGFLVKLGDGRSVSCRTLLLATGVVDRLPEIEGASEMYGKSIFHCPYCDGWEARDRPLAAYGLDRAAYGLAFSLKTWSPDVVLLTDGPCSLGARARARLARHGIPLREDRIVRVEGGRKAGSLRRILFEDGPPLERRALFFQTGQYQRSPLAERLGCEFNDLGTVRTNRFEGAGVAGLYVAGDASDDVQFVVVAAAEGAKAGVAMNQVLQRRDLKVHEGEWRKAKGEGRKRGR